MGKFYFAFAWDVIVNLHVCICKNKICIWSDPGVNLPICKYTPVCICVRMRHLLTPSKICTPEYIYTCVFLAHANWTLDSSFDVAAKMSKLKYNIFFMLNPVDPETHENVSFIHDEHEKGLIIMCFIV